jgi:glycosyltransferase involved in cell wall biosynthesis
MPSLIPLLEARRIFVLGCTTDLATEDWAQDPRIDIREFQTAIFSPAEQLAGLRGVYRDTHLLWVPQYNIPLLYRGKLVVTIHDVCHLALPETLGSDLQRWYSRRLFSTVAARADAIFCVSEFTAKEVQKYLKVDSSRLIVTYPTVVTARDQFAMLPSETTDAPYLLAVGNLKRHKNLKVLLSAFQLIKDRIPHRLIVVGKREGFLNSEIGINTDLEQSDGRVRFTGQVSEQELTMYYKKADALVFPSLYEGFGFPLIEAMSQGCPVACSNVASLPEVAGEAAIYFDPTSIVDISKALVMITTDTQLKEVLVQRGYNRVEQFRTQPCAEKTAAVINRLLGASAS